MNLKKFVVVSLAALLCVGLLNSSAYGLLFRNGSTDGMWNNPDNWTEDDGATPANRVPSPAENALITHLSPAWSPTVGTIGFANETNIATWGADAFVTVNAGAILNVNYLKVGTVGTGTFNNYGTVNITNSGQLMTGNTAGGHGVINQYSGSLSGAYLFNLSMGGGTSELNIYGGSMTTSLLRVPATTTINITEGELIFQQGFDGAAAIDALVYAQSLIDDGLLVGYGGNGDVNYRCDNDLWKCVVTAVPEPASMVLLGLGGLLLRRRR